MKRIKNILSVIKPTFSEKRMLVAKRLQKRRSGEKITTEVLVMKVKAHLTS